jgi:DNA-binding response OmpR family regulator
MAAQNSEEPLANFAANHTQEKFRILIVDDEPDVTDILACYFTQLGGCEVQVANEAKAALVTISKEALPFHGILLDLRMPGISGIELCSIIRKLPGYEAVPIVILTAMTEKRYLVEAFSNGADDFLLKPFEISDVTKALVKARRRTQRNSHYPAETGPVDSSVSICPARPPLTLDDPTAVLQTKGWLSHFAFETLISQVLERSKSSVLLRALKLARAHEVFEALGPYEYHTLLSRIAVEISKAAFGADTVATHYGNGFFLLSSCTSLRINEKDLSYGLKRLEMVGDRQASFLRPRVFLGPSVTVRNVSSSSLTEGIADAVTLADRMEADEWSWWNFRQWQSFSRSVGRESSRIEQARYQNVLNDFISEGELGRIKC